jgi:hypothetical protein
LIAELTAPIVLPKVDPIPVPPIAATAEEKKNLTHLVEELHFGLIPIKAISRPI